MQRRIYLASPYTSNNAKLRQDRYLAACRVTATMLRRGDLVFSPIAHSHPLVQYDLPQDFEFWQNWCLSYLRSWATDLCVLQLDGWKDSKGVAAEIDVAHELGLAVYTFSDWLERTLEKSAN